MVGIADGSTGLAGGGGVGKCSICGSAGYRGVASGCSTVSSSSLFCRKVPLFSLCGSARGYLR